jgi:hypothetical protein
LQNLPGRRTVAWAKPGFLCSGTTSAWGHRVIPGPQNPAMIYVTTFGGRVWYGPAGGDPQAIEDMVTPALA